MVSKIINNPNNVSATINNTFPDQFLITYKDTLLANSSPNIKKIYQIKKRTSPSKINIGKNTLINQFNPILTNITVPNTNPVKPKNRKMVYNIDNIKHKVNQANIIALTQSCPTNYNPPVLNKYNTKNSSHIINHYNTMSYIDKSIKGNEQ